MIAAACLPLIVGAAGLATDTIQWTMWKRQLQRAADSAAIAGVFEQVLAAERPDRPEVAQRQTGPTTHHPGESHVGQPCRQRPGP